MSRYKRVLIKLSGGAIAGHHSFGFDPTAVEHIVREVLEVRHLGVQVAIVIGGGNIFRGRISEAWDIPRVEGDNMGMMATVINAVLLRAAIKARHEAEVKAMQMSKRLVKAIASHPEFGEDSQLLRACGFNTESEIKRGRRSGASKATDENSDLR